MESFAKRTNDFQPLAGFKKSTILDVLEDSEQASTKNNVPENLIAGALKNLF